MIDVDDMTAWDFFQSAYRKHLEGIGARLHPRVRFEACDAHPCVLFFQAASRVGRAPGGAA